MQIVKPDQGLAYEPFDPKLKRCGAYIKNIEAFNPKPQTHIAMPLKHIDYDIEITNSLCSVTLEQKYYNPTQKFLEVEFSFPIDPKSCIYKFVAEFADTRIEGIVKEKEQAKKEYKEAVSQGKQAVFAEIDPNSSDIMNLEIGNISPETEVKISISYLQELSIEQNTFYQLRLPSTISPRYMNNRVGRRFCMKTQSVSGDYTWSFKITLQTTHKIIYDKSPSHKLQLLNTNDPGTEKVFVLPEEEVPNKDLTFLFTTENFHLPGYVFGRTDVSSTAMLSFIPKFCELNVDDAYRASVDSKALQTDMSAAKGEYIFLLDRSGSMGGARIEKAKKALVIFLQSLPENTYFNVISFGNNSSLLFKESVKFDGKNLEKAVKEVERMRADMGGTEIYTPLRNIYNRKNIEGYPRQIFLLTDGGVSNTNGVIELVEKRTKYSRCHSIGIGNGCSQALIKGCAEKGRGKFIFITDSENPSDKIIGLLEETLTPVIDSVKLKYDAGLVESIVPNPHSIPYILKNEQVNFYVTFKGQLDKKAHFSFGYEDSQNRTPFSSDIEVDPESSSFPFVDKMAHFKIIKNLEKAARTNEPVEEEMFYVKVKDYKKEAVEHSVKHQVLSEFTAFLCVSKELVDGKFQEVQDKGQEKVKVENVKPIDYEVDQVRDLMSSNINSSMDRGIQLDSLCMKSTSLNASSRNFARAKKKSAGFNLGIGDAISGAFNSVSNGISGMFGSSSKKNSAEIPANRPMSTKGDCRMSSASSINQEQSLKQHMKKPSSSVTIKKKSSQKEEEKLANIMQCKQKCEDMSLQDEEDDMQICQNVAMEVQQKNKSKKKDKKNTEKRRRRSVDRERAVKKSNEENASSSQGSDELENQKMDIEEFNNSKPAVIKASISIEEVIKRQNTDGSFSDEYLLKNLFSQKELQEFVEKYQLKVVLSYLVARWIEKFHPQKQYSLIAKKALSWVKKTVRLEELTALDQHVQ